MSAGSQKKSGGRCAGMLTAPIARSTGGVWSVADKDPHAVDDTHQDTTAIRDNARVYRRMKMRKAYVAALLLAVWHLSSSAAEGVERTAPKANGARVSTPLAAAARERCQDDPARCREERLARMNERFSRADADGNGALSRLEAERSVPGLARQFDRVDANRDGQLTREEIMAWRTQKRREACKAAPERCVARMQARLAERFRRADTDGNGALSLLEAEKSMPRLARRFDALDANRDGHITVEEILAARRARAFRQGATS
jgi:Ca2+-binding EF-hand superfamily protein